VYVRRDGKTSEGEPPIEEPLLLSLVTEGDFFRGKGLAAAILERLGIYEWSAEERSQSQDGVEYGVTYRPLESEAMLAGRSAEILFHTSGEKSRRMGVIGELSEDIMKMCGCERKTVGIELRLDGLEFTTKYEPKLLDPSSFPSIDRVHESCSGRSNFMGVNLCGD